MCAGMSLLADAKNPESVKKIYFPNPAARVPFEQKGIPEQEAIWGIRHKEEFPDTGFPVTGWSRYESLNQGKWNRFNPKKVLIPAAGYMEKDSRKESHWFELQQEERLCGLVLQWNDLKFIYVVTIPTPDEYAHIHHRWVLIKNIATGELNTFHH